MICLLLASIVGQSCFAYDDSSLYALGEGGEEEVATDAGVWSSVAALLISLPALLGS